MEVCQCIGWRWTLEVVLSPRLSSLVPLDSRGAEVVASALPQTRLESQTRPAKLGTPEDVVIDVHWP